VESTSYDEENETGPDAIATVRVPCTGNHCGTDSRGWWCWLSALPCGATVPIRTGASSVSWDSFHGLCAHSLLEPGSPSPHNLCLPASLISRRRKKISVNVRIYVLFFMFCTSLSVRCHIYYRCTVFRVLYFSYRCTVGYIYACTCIVYFIPKTVLELYEHVSGTV
jgi:hypothetical protein